MAFRRGHGRLGRVDVLSCAGKRPRVGAFQAFLLGTAAFAIALTFAVPLSLIGVRYNSTAIAAFIDLLILVTASTPRIVLALVALAVSVRLTVSGMDQSSAVLFGLALALSAPLISVFWRSFTANYSGRCGRISLSLLGRNKARAP